MALETKALLVQAERARLFEHNGNRGMEAERSVLRWLRARFAPHYTVSPGEIIDSFDTPGDAKSRQQDGVLHRNDAEANRFLLPSGMRLLPIETVAAVVEVKLTLSKEEFERADRAAAETSRLRYRVPARGALLPSVGPPYTALEARAIEDGLPVDDARLGRYRPTFAIFAFGGTREIETIATWLAHAQAVTLVCCLEAGCAMRLDSPASLSDREGALTLFAECLRGAVGRYEQLYQAVKPDLRAYGETDTLPYWDDVGYDWPDGYSGTPRQNESRERLFQARPSLRPRGR